MPAIASVPARLGRRLLGAGLLGGALLLAGCAVGPMVPVYPGDGAMVAQPYTTYETYGTYGTYAPYGYSYSVQPVYPAVVPPPVVWIGGTWRSRPDYRRPPGPPPHWGGRPGPGPGPGPGWHRPPQGGPGPGRGPGHAGPPPPGDRPSLPGSRGGGR